eukprot:GHVR01081733.1.p1 GENE.GHVR01081733.1~~GHVR01081733.1.p1  ORF type:complete len:111 (+),score=12.45 GHVR01081733.1:470-802(+)
MVGVQTALVVIFSAFAVILYRDLLSIEALLAFGAIVGCCNGLVQPIREKLLMQVRAVALQRKISSASVVQFSCQGAGVLMVSLAVYVDLAILLTAQALLSAVAAFQYRRL